MGTKHAIVFLLVTILFGLVLSVPSAITSSPYQSANSELFSAKQEVSLASNEPLEEVKMNINENPSFETMDTNDWPESYFGGATTYCYTDSAYTTNKYSGTYAGFIEGHSVAGGGQSQASLYPSIPGSPGVFLLPGLTLDFYWNTLTNPDIGLGARVYAYIQTINATGFYHEIRYYLSNNYFSLTNSSIMTIYSWNYATDTWHYFSRDIEADYNANPFNPPADSTTRVTWLAWYAESPTGSRGTLKFVVDDVVLTNGTYSSWITNGDFETGDGQGWSGSYSTPTYVTQSTECTDGTYSLNMTTGLADVSSGWGLLTREYSYPGGQYCHEPGLTIVEFDWKYSGTLANLYESASFEVILENAGVSYYCHFYLGFGANELIGIYNTTTHIRVGLDGFDVRDEWHHAEIDLYDYFSLFGSGDGAITKLRFYVYTPGTGSQISLLVDDFLIITSPTGDPGFEIDWYDGSHTPFAAWECYFGNRYTIIQTTDSFSGNYACNLTPYTDHSNEAGVLRSPYVYLGPDDFLNAWWRLDAMSNVVGSYARLKLELDGGRSLNYVFGAASSYTPENSTWSLYFRVDGFNTTGEWTNLHRNITADAHAGLYLTGQIQLTAVIILTHSDYVFPNDNLVTLIIDDVIITDGAPPVISEVNQLPTSPMYYDDVSIHIVASDMRPGIDYVQVNYTIDGGSNWYAVPTTGTYDAVIPAQPYATEVQYYIIAVDLLGLKIIDDNDGAFYSYIVDDDINPTVSIDSPVDMAEVETHLLIEVTADDLGSGVAYVEFFRNAALMVTDYSAPYTCDINLDLLDLGMYRITAVARDYEGNLASDFINITIIDTIAPIISSPDDISLFSDDSGEYINWTFSDLRPDSFMLLEDGDEIDSGFWSASDYYAKYIDPRTMLAGVYNYTLVVIDEGGNSISDTVIVTISSAITTTTTSTTTTTTTTSTTTSTTTTPGGTSGDILTPVLIFGVVCVVGVLLVVFVVIPKMKSK